MIPVLRGLGSGPAQRPPLPSHASAPLRRSDAGGERRLQQIAAGRRLPVEHLAGGEHAGPPLQHERVVDLAERNAAGGGDGAIERCRTDKTHRHGVDESGQFGGAQLGKLPWRGLVQQADGRRRQMHGLAQERRQRLLVARRFETALQFGLRKVRPQRDVQRRFAVRRDRVAERRRQRIDAAALEALPRDDGLAAHRLPAECRARSASAAAPRSVRGTASDHGATNPQLDGRSGAISTPAFASTSAQPPSEPSRGQLAPPSASTTASASHAHRAPRAYRTEHRRPRPSRSSDGAT